MFGWFRRRSKRQPEDVGRALALQRLETGRIKLELARALASDPNTAHLAVAAMYPQLAKAISPPQRDDRMNDLLLEVIRANLRPRDTTAEWAQMASLLKLFVRDGKDIAAELSGEAEPSTTLDRVLNSGAGEAFGQAAGAIAGQVVSTWMQRQQSQPAAAPQTTVTTLPPTPAPAATVDPAAVLRLLQSTPPDHAATTALDWARQSPVLARVLDQLLSLPEPALPSALQAYAADPQWGAVAHWLLEHPDWRTAFLARLRELARAPATASTNGHQQPSAMGF